MEIIQITASYKPAYIYGGPIQSVARLCETLTRSSENISEPITIQVLTTTANGIDELNVASGKQVLVDSVPVIYFKRYTKDHSHFSPGLLLQLRKIIRMHRSGYVVHIHAWWNLVSVLSCWLAKWYQVPVILSPRGMLTAYSQNNRHSFLKKLFHNIIGKKLLQYCHIHATSDQEKRDILKIINPKRITIIPNLLNINGVDFSLPIKSHDNDPSVFKLLFLSRIEEKKGLELLFDALCLTEIDWHLTIAGSGKTEYVESLKRKAKNLNIANHMEWVGQVTDVDKFDSISQHDLLVLTSYNENFANVVIESLSVGTPVLISDQVGLAPYVQENKLGWICALSAEAIQDKLITAFNQPEEREKIRSIAPLLIKKDFNDNVLVQRYLEMYREVGRVNSW